MKRIYIDMDDTIVNFSKAHEQDRIKCPEIKYPQSQYGFYENLELISLAKDSIWWLNKNFDVWFATAPSVFNPLCYTEKRNSIEKHFGHEFLEKLIIIPDKSLLKGDYLIDDKLFGKGQDKFEGKLIHFGSEDFPSWREILFYFDNENDKIINVLCDMVS